ncbi:hypothetical protein HMI56_001489 [Coelomomyces lativittatus]|nr:hypothetical protein HMI56_001489 [Coelomomyces lativittatus]
MPRRPRTKVHKKSHPPTTLQEAVQAWNEQREGWTSVSLAPPLRPSSGPEKKEVMDSWDPWLDATVTLFPFSGYCPCSFFHSHVLSSGSTFMCPHLLAYHLLKQRTIASSSSTGLESSSVFSVDQEGWKDLCFEYLMHGQVFLESHLNHMNS